MNYKCRHCDRDLTHEVIDLGHQPPSNAYLTFEKLGDPEQTYPLKVFLCEKCWLMQIPEYTSYKELFNADYAYFSSTSTSWCNHAKKYVESTIKKFSLDENNLVVEIASNDGYLLQYVKEKGISCFGIEPTKAAANEARKKGIETYESFFTSSYASNLLKSTPNKKGADLIIANNVLVHVPDINDFVKGISILLNKEGFCSFEFPHVLNLIKGCQFDTIYHEHFSYLSLYNIKLISEMFNLIVCDVEILPTHGGSLRVWICHKGNAKVSQKVTDLLLSEREEGLMNLETYSNFQQKSERIKNDLLRFLLEASANGKKVIGYGAAAKGNTFINFAGISKDLLNCVVDRSKSKQGKYLPGSHIPIISYEDLKERDPDILLILPWNLINELRDQLQGYELVTAIPEIKHWKSI